MYDVLNCYLENGLKIILHKIADVKTISCGLWIKQGSSYETDDNNGLSHLTEHLLLNAKNLKNPEYKEVMQEIEAEGVIYNASTTKEYTCFYFTGLEKTIDLCLTALACIAKDNRTFDRQFFENEKKVVLQEATSFYSSFQQIKERTGQAIWGNMGTGKIIMGNMKNIAEAKPEHIQSLIKDAYVPENATLVVVGNIDYSGILSMIEERFAGWKDDKVKVRELEVESSPGIYLNQVTGASAVISIGFRTTSYSSADSMVVDIITHILGETGMQSRIVQEIRIKRGLAYTTGGFASLYKKHGTLGFMAVCDKHKTTEVAKVMMDILVEAKEKGFTEEEIEREKRVMETSMLLSIDNITEHLRHIGRCNTMDQDFFIENELRAIRNIEKGDVDGMAKEILQERNMGLAAIGECNPDELIEAVAI